METIVNYLLQSGLSLLVLYLFYRLALRNQPSLRYNRLFLLLAPLVALAAPLLRIPLPFAENLPIAAALPAIQLGEVVVVGYRASETSAVSSLSFGSVMLVLYTLVGLVLLGRLAWQLVRVHRLAAASTPLPHVTPEATVLQTETQYASFAFLHYVFLSRQAHLSEEEQRQVLAHELAHVRLRHTYDILYYELLTALLWFNPLVWLLKEELRDVHEYQADAQVLAHQYQPQAYSALLAKEALYTAGIPVGSYFQKPQVFRRLHMLQQYGRKQSLLRPLLALPLLLTLLITFSINSVSADRVLPLTEPTSLTEVLESSPAPKPAIPKTEDQNVNTQETTKELKQAATVSEPANHTATAPVLEALPAVTDKATATPAQPEPGNSERLKPYTYVEQMPQFTGGEGAMIQFLGTNIQYPADARAKGVEGLVVISFVVETDGSLHDITVLKKLHGDADAEALRVVQEMNGHWNPGKQNGKPVPVRYTLPVRFAMK